MSLKPKTAEADRVMMAEYADRIQRACASDEALVFVAWEDGGHAATSQVTDDERANLLVQLLHSVAGMLPASVDVLLQLPGKAPVSMRQNVTSDPVELIQTPEGLREADPSDGL